MVAAVLVGTPAAPAAAAPREVRPVLECVMVNGDGTYTAVFGYESSSSTVETIAHGGRNRLVADPPPPASSPESFEPGRHVAVFSVTTAAASVTWRVWTLEATATAASTPCATSATVPEAPIAVLLLLAPAATAGWWITRQRRHAMAV
jgi:hypothetical protein